MADAAIAVADRLYCPVGVDRLTRTSASADGRSCAYIGSNGLEVTLTLDALNGASPEARLAGLETELRTEVGGLGPDPSAAPKPPPEADGDDHARIDLPGLHIDADDKGASVRLPGVSVNASDAGADIRTGLGGRESSTVRAFPGGAEIRSRGGGSGGVTSTYVLSRDKPGPSGYQVAGYLAKGAQSGPLLVGVFKSRGGHDPHGDGLDRLMAMNTRRPG